MLVGKYLFENKHSFFSSPDFAKRVEIALLGFRLIEGKRLIKQQKSDSFTRRKHEMERAKKKKNFSVVVASLTKNKSVSICVLAMHPNNTDSTEKLKLVNSMPNAH